MSSYNNNNNNFNQQQQHQSLHNNMMDNRNNNHNTNDNDEVTSSIPTCYVHLQDSSRNNEMRIMPLTAPISLASFRNIHPQTLQDVSTLIECDSRTSNPVRSGKIVAAKSDMLLPGKHYIVRQSGARNDDDGENNINNFNSTTAINNNNMLQQQQQQQQRTKSAPGVTFNSMMQIREYSLSFANSVSQSPSNHHLHHHQFEQPQLPPHFSFPRSRNNNNIQQSSLADQQQQQQQQQQQRLTQQLERVQRDSCFQPNNLDVTSENFIVPQFEGDRDAIDFSTSLQSCNNNVNIFPMTYYYSTPSSASASSQQQKPEQQAALHSQDELNQMLEYDYEGENKKLKDEYQQLVGGR